MQSKSKGWIFWVILVLGAGAIILAGVRMSALELWSHWPLVLGLGFSACMASLLLWTGKDKISLIASIASGLLLGVAYPPSPMPIMSFMGFIPLLYIIDRSIKYQDRRHLRKLWPYFYLSFLIWNVIATFWVMNTAFVAGIFANLVNAFLMTLPLCAYFLIRKYLASRLHWIAFVAFWIGFEYFHFHWDLQWPWLCLGNAFADWTWAIQWYEYTGPFGGSLWILLVNYLIYEFLIKRKFEALNLMWPSMMVFLPMILSMMVKPDLALYKNKLKVAIIQPNFEPHYEKFTISEGQQILKIKSQIREVIDSTTDLLILPETVFRVQLNRFDREPGIRMLRTFLEKYPQLEVITGISTQRIYEKDEKDQPYTRYHTYSNGDEIRWEAGNVALHLKKASYDLYYKNKLVPGAEKFPYHQLFFFMQDLVDQLGGSVKGLRTEGDTKVFQSSKSKVAPIICYESIFTEFCRGYVAKGADLFAVMTNDGWWDETSGHKQHLAYAKILAISHRRSIVRAANTGISAFVGPDGSLQKPTGYEEDAAIVAEVPLNHTLTTFALWGNLIGRISLFLILAILFQGVASVIRMKTGKPSKRA